MGVRRAIGLMSGTSLDGVDVGLIETDGETVAAFGPVGYRRYGEGERTILRRALAEAVGLADRDARPGVIGEAERIVTEAHADAVETFIDAHGIDRREIDVIGFHGQTVLHRPAHRLTVQLGNGNQLAQRLGIEVIYDFRAADLAAGGQGAPLVPVFHLALARDLVRARPLGILNVGGVANVTVVDGAAAPIACDTGPGNALLDDFMLARTGVACDPEGAAAAQGRVDEAFVDAVLRQDFFARKCPKSLDRNEFTVDTSMFSTPDGAATLTALTATAAARVTDHLPARPRAWIVAGGGARNPTLMRMLAERLAPASVETASAVGWSIDSLEAQAFAFLAVRCQRGMPITFPTTTGVAAPLSGGRVARATLQRVAV